MAVTLREALVAAAVGYGVYTVTRKGKLKLKDKYRVPAAVVAGPVLVMALNRFIPSAPV